MKDAVHKIKTESSVQSALLYIESCSKGRPSTSPISAKAKQTNKQKNIFVKNNAIIPDKVPL